MKRTLKTINKRFNYWQGKFVPGEQYQHTYLGNVKYVANGNNGRCLVELEKYPRNPAVLTRNSFLYL